MQCCTVLVPYDQEPDTRAAAEAASSFEGPVPPDLDLENLSERGEKSLFPGEGQDDQDLFVFSCSLRVSDIL